MKASELRLGNYIEDDNSNLIQITDENWPYVVNRYWLKSHHPIPLTEEWLLKFGFSHDIGSTYDLSFELEIGTLDDENEIYGRIDVILDNKSCRIHSGLSSDSDGYGFKCKMEYIHQLQNLYFALTGEELTIKE